MLIYLLLTMMYHWMCVRGERCTGACTCCQRPSSYVPMEVESNILRSGNMSDVELGDLSSQEETAQ